MTCVVLIYNFHGKLHSGNGKYDANHKIENVLFIHFYQLTLFLPY